MKRKEYFNNRSDMYHYAASADYDGGYIRSNNSHIEKGVHGYDVYSYATKVAMFDKDKEILLYTGHYYSNTTTHSLYELRSAFDHYKRLEVYDFNINDAQDRLRREVKLHTKHPATRKADKEFFMNAVYSLENLVEFYGNNCKYLKSKIMEKAMQIAITYSNQIEKHNKRVAELRAIREAKEEQERQERIARTEAIIKEYMPDYEGEPKTFRECMEKTNLFIPTAWMKEHHPELWDEDGCYNGERKVLFFRNWDYNIREYTNFEYRRERYNIKLLRHIHRYSTNYTATPDILVYNKDKKLLYTSQSCEVDDTAGHCKNLLGLFLKAIDEGRDYSFVNGKHCGPYDIRGYDEDDEFLRVGCHCFLLENLREVYEDMKGV